MLNPSIAPARILEIGCGTGLLTALLARVFSSAQIDAVDISAAMTEKARKNLADNKMINWINADVRNFSASVKYSLIASSCALHWIAPLKPLVVKLCSLLEQDGRLAIALMTRGTLKELNACRERIAPHKSARVILPVEADVRNAVAKAGLQIISEKSETIQREYSSAKQMVRQLHDQGLTGENYPSGNVLLTRDEISRLITDYTAHYAIDGRVYASYRFYCCIADKKQKG